MSNENTNLRDTELNKIAKATLHLETLQTRNGDAEDFSEQAVWTLKLALEQAYAAGRMSAS